MEFDTYKRNDENKSKIVRISNTPVFFIEVVKADNNSYRGKNLSSLFDPKVKIQIIKALKDEAEHYNSDIKGVVLSANEIIYDRNQTVYFHFELNKLDREHGFYVCFKNGKFVEASCGYPG